MIKLTFEARACTTITDSAFQAIHTLKTDRYFLIVLLNTSNNFITFT